MHNPKISVIILVNGNYQGLQKTLDSISQQTYFDIECLIADNGSSKFFCEIVKRSSANIVYSFSENQAHKSKLVEAVLPHSKGDFIMLVSSGNYLYDENVIQRLVESCENCDLIYGNMLKYYHGSFEKNELHKYPNKLSLNNVVYHTDDILAVSLIKATVFETIKLCDESIFFVHEWAFFLNAYLQDKFNIFHIEVIVASIAVGRHGGTDKLSNIQLIDKEKKKLINTYIPSFASNTEEVQRTSKRSLLDGGLKNDRFVVNFGEKAKRYYRSLRSRTELINYRNKFGKTCFDIPIIINNINHLTYLQRLIASLEKRGYNNIYIIDNNSDYPPLVDFYKETKYKVFALKENVGFCALWDTDVFDLFKDQYYVYTDSDLELVEECPDDFMVVLHYLLNKYSLGKVGLSLMTNDLPLHFENRLQVQEWESKFQKERVERLAYKAMVDTTFALYRPNSFGDAGMLDAFRARFPYSARHLPWYENTSSLTDEQQYYYKNAKTSSHWTKMIKDRE